MVHISQLLRRLLRRLSQEDHKLQASPGNLVRPRAVNCCIQYFGTFIWIFKPFVVVGCKQNTTYEVKVILPSSILDNLCWGLGLFGQFYYWLVGNCGNKIVFRLNFSKKDWLYMIGKLGLFIILRNTWRIQREFWIESCSFRFCSWIGTSLENMWNNFWGPSLPHWASDSGDHHGFSPGLENRDFENSRDLPCPYSPVGKPIPERCLITSKEAGPS